MIGDETVTDCGHELTQLSLLCCFFVVSGLHALAQLHFLHLLRSMALLASQMVMNNSGVVRNKGGALWGC